MGGKSQKHDSVINIAELNISAPNFQRWRIWNSVNIHCMRDLSHVWRRWMELMHGLLMRVWATDRTFHSNYSYPDLNNQSVCMWVYTEKRVMRKGNHILFLYKFGYSNLVLYFLVYIYDNFHAATSSFASLVIFVSVWGEGYTTVWSELNLINFLDSCVYWALLVQINDKTFHVKNRWSFANPLSATQ